MNDKLLDLLRQRTVEGAVGTSALRNQGAPGVIDAARKFLKKLDLSLFVTTEEGFLDILNSSTKSMQKQFPPNAKHWGAARKGLNLFLRDILYNRYLSESFEFERIEKWMEVPLDSFVAKGILEDYAGEQPLPPWPGLKRLTPKISALYQKAAYDLGESVHLSRVHLDAFYWRELGHVKDFSTS
jgi:hypothetical protein